jgi:hypothetical protein
MSNQRPEWRLHQAPTSVLYLRSFEDDLRNAEVADINAFWPFKFATQEEQLVKALKTVGPVVAIGKPGEKHPELGATRFYLGNDEWKQAVSEWIPRARLVVLRIGRTGGIWWEVQTALQQARPERLLFTIPNDNQAYREFCARVKSQFSLELPTKVNLSPYSLSGLGGFVYFDEDRILQFSSVTKNPSPRNIKKSLRIVFQRLGVT